jgi:uncharacterized protein (DUF362 family)
MQHHDHAPKKNPSFPTPCCPYARQAARMTRRSLLGRGLTGLAGAAGLSALPGCFPNLAAAAPPEKPFPEDARVAAIQGSDLHVMTREALEAFGGAESLIVPGETVFIKVNLCTAGLVSHDPIPTGDATKPEIALTVAEECLKAGAARVTIGDAAQVKSFDWNALHTLDGESTFAQEAAKLNQAYDSKLHLACLNTDSTAWVEVPSPHTSLGVLQVSNMVTEADKIISIPVLKTHQWTQITGALKNFIGVTSTSTYGLGSSWRFGLHEATGGIEQCILDLGHSLRPHFSLMDCTICCEGNGPHVLEGWWGSRVDVKERLGSWLLLAGNDPVAVDATAARVINLDPTQIAYLSMAHQQGIGQMQEAQITLDGATLGQLQMEWQPAEPLTSNWDVLLPGIAMLLS